MLHKTLHNGCVVRPSMPRIATKLTPTSAGGFVARKRIPTDVQDAYAKLYGQRWEERLNSGPDASALARAKHREWSNEIEARIANIRAERKGEGRTLAPKEARALAGEWYGWFTARMAARKWGPRLGAIRRSSAQRALWPGNEPRRVCRRSARPWQRDSGMRERVRPMVADWSESGHSLPPSG